MFQDVERYIEFIVKNKLTQSQFLFLYLIKRKKFHLINSYKQAFPSDDGTMIGKSLLNDLISRNFIKVNDEGKLAKDYEVTEIFDRIFLKDRWECAMQIWQAYPGFVNIGGVNSPLTATDKYQFSLDYAERIDYSIDEHLEILKDVVYGAQKGLIRTTIDKFVKSSGWEKIRIQRIADKVNNKVINQDF